MSDALEIAIRAEEAAKSAHHRLDRMNGSIDRLGREVGDLRASISAARAEATANCEAILRRLDRQAGLEDGAARVHHSLLDNRRLVVGLAATFLTSSSFAVILTFLLRGHT